MCNLRLAFQERDELLKLKAEEHTKYGYPADDKFYIWFVFIVIFFAFLLIVYYCLGTTGDASRVS